MLLKMIVDCCIQETDDICGDSSSNIAWNECWWFEFWGLFTSMWWLQHWSGVRLGHQSVYLERYPAHNKRSWTVRTKTWRRVCLVSSTQILDTERKLYRLMIQWRAQCSFDVIVLISLWENPRPENRTIFSIITGRILVITTATLVWGGNLHKAVGPICATLALV